MPVGYAMAQTDWATLNNIIGQPMPWAGRNHGVNHDRSADDTVNAQVGYVMALGKEKG